MRFFLGSTLLAMLLLSGCGEQAQEKKTEPTQSEQSTIERKAEVKVVEVQKEETKIQEVANNLKVKTNEAIDVAAKMAEELTKESEKMVGKIQEESKVVVKEVAKQTKELSTVAVETMNEAKKELDTQMDKVIQEKEDEAAENSDAKALYLKCAGCHGQKAERAALNKSQIIQGWTAQQIIDALMGYKMGTYGGDMKGLMKAQVATLNDRDIEILAEYIATLK